MNKKCWMCGENVPTHRVSYDEECGEMGTIPSTRDICDNCVKEMEQDEKISNIVVR